MDLSDGLSLDLHRLTSASGVAATLDFVPVAPGASFEQALHGGEDYELLYTGRNLPGIRIGTIDDGPPGLVQLDRQPVEPHGFDHFRSRRH